MLDIDPGIFIVRGKNSADESKSIVNLKLFVDQTTGAMTFGAYDGNGDTRSSVACEDGKTYRIKVICDPTTDTYDFYVDDHPAIIGGRMRGDAGNVVSFRGIRLTLKKNSGETAAVARYDNMLITGLEICEDESGPSDNLLFEEFNTAAGFDNLGEGWTTQINAAGQLQITTTATNSIYRGLKVAEHPADATVTVEWEIVENINGSGFHGDIALWGSKATLNVYVKGGYFMVADGGEGEATATQQLNTNVQCVDGQLYKFKAILDFATKTYSLYIDGDLITEGRSLRPGADKLSYFVLEMKENSEGMTASVCYDNILVYETIK